MWEIQNKLKSRQLAAAVGRRENRQSVTAKTLKINDLEKSAMKKLNSRQVLKTEDC